MKYIDLTKCKDPYKKVKAEIKKRGGKAVWVAVKNVLDERHGRIRKLTLSRVWFDFLGGYAFNISLDPSCFAVDYIYKRIKGANTCKLQWRSHPLKEMQLYDINNGLKLSRLYFRKPSKKVLQELA